MMTKRASIFSDGFLSLVAAVVISQAPFAASCDSEGTTATTPDESVPYFVKDITPGPASTGVLSFVDFNSMLVFSVDDGVSGTELWMSDGSPQGTRLLRDINPGSGPSSPKYFHVVQNILYFHADDGRHGAEPWRSDGTTEGTWMVSDILPGSDSSYPYNFIDLHGRIFFSAYDDVHGTELWSTDGTTAGTVLVKDIWPGAEGSSPNDYTVVNGNLFFQASDRYSTSRPDGRLGIWKSDGTEEGTVLVRADFPGRGPRPESLYLMGVLGGELTIMVSQFELWKTNGTAEGTTRLKEFSGAFRPTYFVVAWETLFFGGQGMGLWKSNGTAAGTTLLRGGDAEYLTSSSGTGGGVFFKCGDAAHGREICISDGTPEGTRLVKDIRPGTASSNPEWLTNGYGTLFFEAEDRAESRRLWKSDGTAERTHSVGNFGAGFLTVAGEHLFFMADDGVHGLELWALRLR